MAQIPYFEVAATVFVVTFSLNCARNGSLPLGSSEWIRRQHTSNDGLTVPLLWVWMRAVTLLSSPRCGKQQALLLERFLW